MQMFNNGKKYLFILLIILFSLQLNYSEEKAMRSIDSIISDIRKEQGLAENDKINPDKTSLKLLEELGDAVMEKMIGDHERHEIMDRMMGGEGSRNLAVMHRRMGYNYLSGNSSWPGGSMMEYGWMNGMMYGYPYNNNYKGGFPMMWNNGYGMMGWGFGGLLMGLLFFIFLIAVGFAIYFTLKVNKGNSKKASEDESALDILKKRYAGGEITKKQYDEIKKDL